MVKLTLYKKLKEEFNCQFDLLYLLSFAPSGLTEAHLKFATQQKARLDDSWQELFTRITVREPNLNEQISQNNRAKSNFKIVLKQFNPEINETVFQVIKNESTFII